MPSKGKTGGAYKGKTKTPRTSSTPSTRKSGGFTVEGKSVNELLRNGSMHLHQYKEENLRAIVTRLSSAANKRLRRAEQSGFTDSPAYQEVQRSGGKFSGKGKDLEGLKSEFIRLKQYFGDQTSTQAGWNRVKENATRRAQSAGVLPGSGTNPPTSNRENRWHYDPESDSFWNPEYGKGWQYDSATDSYEDPATGEIVQSPSAPRQYHDYDATQDPRKTATGTETGDIWAMVDSLAKIDPDFTRQIGGYGPDTQTLRMLLFDEIDNEYVRHPELTLEQVRDIVAGRLDDIKARNNEFYGEASKIGESEFM